VRGSDLNRGFETSDAGAASTLKPGGVPTIIDAALAFGSTGAVRGTEFISFRNNLNKLLGTPFELQQGWEMGCESIVGRDSGCGDGGDAPSGVGSGSAAPQCNDGNGGGGGGGIGGDSGGIGGDSRSTVGSSRSHCIVLDVRKTQEQMQRDEEVKHDEWQGRMQYHGRRFEELCCGQRAAEEFGEGTRTASGAPGKGGRGRGKGDFCGLFRCTLGGNSLLLAAEIDCYDDFVVDGNSASSTPASSSSAVPRVALAATTVAAAAAASTATAPSRRLPDQATFVELKVTGLLDTARARDRFERKLLKYVRRLMGEESERERERKRERERER
jgi:hypothetical protein